MAAPADVTVGIDVAKAQLDVAVQPTGTTWTVPRARGGLRRLQGQLEALRPTGSGAATTGPTWTWASPPWPPR